MMDFFPEFAKEIEDPRKEQITVRHLLQMRGGYPDEEMTSNYFEIMFFQDNWEFLPHLVDFPLTSDPGTEFQYSNLTSHLLGVIVTRACGADLESFAQQYLFSPMNARVSGWQVDNDGYNTTLSGHRQGIVFGGNLLTSCDASLHDQVLGLLQSSTV